MIRISCAGVLTLVLGLALGPLGATLGAQSASAYKDNADKRFRAGELDGAIADLTTAISLDPKDAETWTQRGYMRMQRLDVRGAIADFTEAIQLAPDVAGIY